ncbi:MAG: CPBP family intramembrane metalloprotease [Lachnospiraceae bacterium]|nr:CPBP family intramembrane metalloprotease [Lachnospiraceae bacterium]
MTGKSAPPDGTGLKMSAACALLGVVTALLAGYLLGFILPLFPGVMEEYTSTITNVIDDGASALLYVAFLAPLLEEILFRFVIYKLVRKVINAWAALVIQAVLFAIYHSNAVQRIYAFLLGLLLGYLIMKTERLLYCIVFHCAFNITGIILDSLSNKIQPLPIRLLILVISFVLTVFIMRYIIRPESIRDGQTD